MIDPITQAIVSLPDIGPIEKQQGAALVDAYITRFADDPEKFDILEVEVPWYVWLTPQTLVVGVIDQIRRSKETSIVEGLELKTRRAPKIKKDGQPYKGDTEADWKEELINSPQLNVYAMALMMGQQTDGAYLFSQPYAEKEGYVHLRIRAAIKSEPPMLWPTNDDGLFTFSPEACERTVSILRAEADAVRTMRRSGVVPWQMQGSWCRQYGRDCDHFKVCRERENPTGDGPAKHSPSDPGSQAIEAALRANRVFDESELVIFSASSYSDWGTCKELYRLNTGGYFPQQSTQAMQTGTVFHAGVAVWAKQFLT